MTVRLYVGNLPKEPIERQALQDLFADAGDSVATKVIKDRKTGKCRGFAFVTVPSDEVADEFIEKYNGQPFMDNPLKIEKALPRAKGKNEEASSRPETASNQPSKRQGKKRSRNLATSSHHSSDVQPDPRWADELAKLKEMLAAQTANS